MRQAAARVNRSGWRGVVGERGVARRAGVEVGGYALPFGGFERRVVDDVVGRNDVEQGFAHGVVHRVGTPAVSIESHMPYQHARAHKTGEPGVSLTVFEQIIFVFIRRVLDAIGRSAEVFAAKRIEPCESCLRQFLNIEPPHHAAFVSIIADRGIAVVEVLPVVHNRPNAGREDLGGIGFAFAGVIEVGQVEGMTDFVDKDTHAVELLAFHHDVSAFVFLIRLQHLVAHEI